MNPELSAPPPSPESRPVGQDTETHPLSPEIADGGAREREQAMQQVDRQSSPPPPPIAIAAPLPPVPVPATQLHVDDAVGPTLAADDDLIEKEWVDKAKKIIAETKDDPYRREQEVSKLQADYLRKRYGKELGVSN